MVCCSTHNILYVALTTLLTGVSRTCGILTVFAIGLKCCKYAYKALCLPFSGCIMGIRSPVTFSIEPLQPSFQA